MEDQILNAFYDPKSEEKPLLIVNGVISDSSLLLVDRKFKASSLSVVTPTVAIRKYGPSGINGAIEFYNLVFLDR